MTSKLHHRLLVFPLDEILTVYENDHIDPPWSHALVLGFDAIAILAVLWCVRQAIEARRAAKQAQRFERSSLPLHEGARFVAGHVELAEGSKKAIRVTIKQEGTEFEQRNGHTHLWTEVDRHVEAEPFYVRTPNGERVRVEPPFDVMLVDKLDQMEWLERTRRRRRAELVPGERAVIEGKLERGPDPELQSGGSSYRTPASMGWVMRPTKQRGMAVSAEGLSRRHELRARAFIWTTVWVFLIGVGVVSAFLPYHLRLFHGKAVVAEYMGKEIFDSRDGRGRLNKHNYVLVKYGDDEQHSQIDRFDVDSDDYALLAAERGQIWIREVKAYPRATALGKNSSVAFWQVAVGAAIFGLAIWRIARTHRYRRWYEGRVIEEGMGTLPAPTNTRFDKDTRP